MTVMLVLVVLVLLGAIPAWARSQHWRDGQSGGLGRTVRATKTSTWQRAIAGALILMATTLPSGPGVSAEGPQPPETAADPTLPIVMRTSRILASPVANSQDEVIARVHDLAIRFDDGQVSFLVLGHGGVLWVGDTYVAVPWGEVTVGNQRLVLDLTAEQLDQLPGFELGAAWPATVAWPPSALTTRVEDPNPNIVHIGVLRARAVIGMPVRNHEGDDLGRVNDLAIRTDDGRITYVVIEHGGVFGVGGRSVAVPIGQLEIDATQGALVLGLSAADLADTPSFAESWPESVEWPFPRPR